MLLSTCTHNEGCTTAINIETYNTDCSGHVQWRSDDSRPSIKICNDVQASLHTMSHFTELKRKHSSDGYSPLLRTYLIDISKAVRLQYLCKCVIKTLFLPRSATPGMTTIDLLPVWPSLWTALPLQCGQVSERPL